MWWRLFGRWIITSIAVAVAMLVVPGIGHSGSSALIAILLTAAVLGFANAIIRPILKFLSCGCIVATLGLFVLVINAVVLWGAAWVSANWFHTGFYVEGFWPAFWGAIVVSIVSFVLSVFLPDPDPDSQPRQY